MLYSCMPTSRHRHSTALACLLTSGVATIVPKGHAATVALSACQTAASGSASQAMGVTEATVAIMDGASRSGKSVVGHMPRLRSAVATLYARGQVTATTT